MASRALELIEALSPEQRERLALRFESGSRRDWHYVPRSRPGIALKSLSSEQRQRVFALLASALSEQGLRKSRDVLLLEGILGELTNSTGYRDPDNYSLAIFGDPAGGAPWSWRFEGHHLSLNFTVVPGQGIAATPQFLGANPATVPAHHHSHAGFRVLGDEENLAFALVQSLREPDFSRIELDAHDAREILTGPGREESLRSPEGAPLGTLPGPARDLGAKLLEAFVGNLRPDLAQVRIDALRESGLDEVHLAWFGSTVPGRAHYFRLHGPTVLIEYDNSRPGANHVHAVWHTPGNAFGDDLLRRHNEQDHG